MANTPALTQQQQEALSRIMSVPVPAAPPAESYQVPELTSQSAPAAAGAKVQTSNAPANVGISGFTNSESPAKKSNALLTISVIIFGLIALGGYTFFWLKFYHFF